jgi:hypothetical protein
VKEVLNTRPYIETRQGEFLVTVYSEGNVSIVRCRDLILRAPVADAKAAVEAHAPFKGHIRDWRRTRDLLLALPFDEYAAKVADMAKNVDWMKEHGFRYLGTEQWSRGSAMVSYYDGMYSVGSRGMAMARGRSVREALAEYAKVVRAAVERQRAELDAKLVELDSLAEEVDDGI